MGNVDGSPQLIWSLATSGLGTSISGAGNSGGLTYPQTSGSGPTSPVNLGRWSDVTIYAYCTGVASSPTWTVSLDVFDDQGTLIPGVLTLAGVTAANSPKTGSIGIHGPTAGTYLVLPQFGRVSWTLPSGSVSGAQISVWGR